jgi:hypothetical protein
MSSESDDDTSVTSTAAFPPLSKKEKAKLAKSKRGKKEGTTPRPIVGGLKLSPPVKPEPVLSEFDEDTDVISTATAPKRDSKDKKTKTTKGKKQGESDSDTPVTPPPTATTTSPLKTAGAPVKKSGFSLFKSKKKDAKPDAISAPPATIDQESTEESDRTEDTESEDEEDQDAKVGRLTKELAVERKNAKEGQKKKKEGKKGK